MHWPQVGMFSMESYLHKNDNQRVLSFVYVQKCSVPYLNFVMTKFYHPQCSKEVFFLAECSKKVKESICNYMETV